MELEAKSKSRDTWDRMASGWHKNNGYMWAVTRQVGERLVEMVDPQPGHTILDLAAGPGNVGFAAAALIGDDGKLLSTDFAEEMVGAARSLGETFGINNAEFKVMDAENMDLPDDRVDGAICRWGYMLMTDQVAAMAETRRVLRPGGRLAFSVWGGPAENPWVTLMGMVMTMRGQPPQGDPFGPGGMFSLSDPAQIEKLVTGAGFTEVEVESMAVHWTFDDFDEYWEFQTEVAGAIAALVADMAPDDVADLKEDVRTAVEPFKGDSGYDVPGETLNVLAS